MARVRGVEGTVTAPIADGWAFAALPPGGVAGPAELAAARARWVPACVPGTAASALAAAGEWSFDRPRDFDADDWWLRGAVDVTPRAPGERVSLRFGGLATLADVWLDGEHILRSDNMFVEHAVDVSEIAAAGNGGARELVVRFASVAEELKKRRPRPRWRAQIVAQQQLRWIRTTLLGRMPTSAPPVAPVGPYRAIAVERHGRVVVRTADVTARREGDDGVVEIALYLEPIAEGRIDGVTLVVGDVRVELETSRDDGAVVRARGAARVHDARMWWPATHGEPALYDVRAVARTDRGEVTIELGRAGFRAIDVERAGDAFGFRVNSVELFARGAVWTPLDVVGFTPSATDVRRAVEQAARAGMNMLRVGGTSLYEGPEFYDACDELGVLVWQDFMFANMEYPHADPAFASSARAEAAQLVDRLQLSPSLALICGNSEIAQQTAMLGLPASQWSSALFDEVLPAIARGARPDVPYLASTPEGGALPFRADAGVSHYYGVGAYRRPLEDARRARVRFTSECLAFANVPCDRTIEAFLADGEMPTGSPRWKARVPRDKGASWDFDDVRDHYVARLFGVDPVELRVTDPARYLELGRVVTGEAILGAVSEWRRAGSECRGALVWMLRDYWAGAGWGLVDAFGRPKAALRYTARAFAPVALYATDEGLNGVTLHAVNDRATPIDAEVRLALSRGETVTARGAAPLALAPRSTACITADAILGRFADVAYAYRFGPPPHDVVFAALVDHVTGDTLGRAFHFPCGYPHARVADLGIDAAAEADASGAWRLTVRTKRLATAIAVDAPGFVADDEFFHVEPGGERTVMLRGAPGASLSGRVVPLNAPAPTKIVVRPRQ